MNLIIIFILNLLRNAEKSFNEILDKPHFIKNFYAVSYKAQVRDFKKGAECD